MFMQCIGQQSCYMQLHATISCHYTVQYVRREATEPLVYVCMQSASADGATSTGTGIQSQWRGILTHDEIVRRAPQLRALAVPNGDWLT